MSSLIGLIIHLYLCNPPLCSRSVSLCLYICMLVLRSVVQETCGCCVHPAPSAGDAGQGPRDEVQREAHSREEVSSYDCMRRVLTYCICSPVSFCLCVCVCVCRYVCHNCGQKGQQGMYCKRCGRKQERPSQAGKSPRPGGRPPPNAGSAAPPPPPAVVASAAAPGAVAAQAEPSGGVPRLRKPLDSGRQRGKPSGPPAAAAAPAVGGPIRRSMSDGAEGSPMRSPVREARPRQQQQRRREEEEAGDEHSAHKERRNMSKGERKGGRRPVLQQLEAVDEDLGDDTLERNIERELEGLRLLMERLSPLKPEKREKGAGDGGQRVEKKPQPQRSKPAGEGGAPRAPSHAAAAPAVGAAAAGRKKEKEQAPGPASPARPTEKALAAHQATTAAAAARVPAAVAQQVHPPAAPHAAAAHMIGDKGAPKGGPPPLPAELAAAAARSAALAAVGPGREGALPQRPTAVPAAAVAGNPATPTRAGVKRPAMLQKAVPDNAVDESSSLPAVGGKKSAGSNYSEHPLSSKRSKALVQRRKESTNSAPPRLAVDEVLAAGNDRDEEGSSPHTRFPPIAEHHSKNKKVKAPRT